MKYRIIIPIQSFYVYEVKAESEEDAIELTMNGEGEEIFDDEAAEGIFDTDSNNWTVKKIESEEEEE